MEALIGTIYLILVITISVGVHEFGHMVPAKLFGATVSEYAIGFGPRLWGFSWRNTDYNLRAIPLGGFVRIIGMFYPGAKDRKTHTKNGKLTVAEQARLDSASETEQSNARPFWSLPIWQKMVVMFGGPFTNLVLALLTAIVAFSGIGTMTATSKISAVTECLPTDSSFAAEGAAKGTCGNDSLRSPAAKAGIKAGDRITKINGISVATVKDMGEVINKISGEAQITVDRVGKIFQTSIEPVSVKRDGLAVKIIGVQGSIELQRVPVSQSLNTFGKMTVQTGKALLGLPVHAFNLVKNLITGTERDPQGIVGIVGVGQIAGKVSAADIPGYTWQAKLSDLLLLGAGINISLFLINLIPLLPLDGGHIAAQLWELGRNTLARNREHKPVDTAKIWPLSYTVFAILTLLGLLLIIADLVMPIVH